MTAHRAPLKAGDTVYVLEKKVRGKVLGRLSTSSCSRSRIHTKN